VAIGDVTGGIHWAAQRHHNKKGPSEIRVLDNINNLPKFFGVEY
jgi:hypothetical protein